MKSLKAEVLEALGRRLQDRGWAAEGRGHVVFMRPLDGGLESWLGVPASSRPGTPVTVHVNVGVRHPHVEREVVRLSGAPAGPLAPTIMAPLARWDRGLASVTLDRPDGRPAVRALDGLADAADKASRALAAEAGTAEGLVAALCDPRLSYPWKAPLSRAVLLRHLGREAEALATVDGAVQELGDRADPAAEQLRRFAGAFRNTGE